MIKQMRASYFHNFKNAQYCALSDDPIPDDLENGDEVYIIDQGKIYYWDESSSSLYEYKGGRGGSGGSSSFVPCFGSLATVSLGTTWSGDDPYVSTVTVTGYTVTNQTMVSVLPSSDVVEQMLADGITNIFITNNDGVLTATVIGATPTVPMTLQVLCTESDISSDITGLPSIVGSGIIQTVEADNLTDAVNILGEDVDDLKNAISEYTDTTYADLLRDKEPITSWYIDADTGIGSTLAGFYSFTEIDVSGYSRVYPKSNDSGTYYTCRSIVFYQADGTTRTGGSGGTQPVHDNGINVPANTKYMSVCFRNNATEAYCSINPNNVNSYALNSQVSVDYSQIKNTNAIANQKRLPAICFEFDDGNAKDADIVSIFTTKGLTCGFALIATGTHTDWLTYQANGFEILSHSTDAVGMDDASVSDSTIEAKLKNSLSALEAEGFVVKGFVTPNSTMNAKFKPLLRKYYQFAETEYLVEYTGTQTPYRLPVDGVYNGFRVSLQSTTPANQIAAVDACIANYGCLTFYGHSASLDGSDYLTTTNLNALLDYINTKISSGECVVGNPSDIITTYFNVRNDDVSDGWIDITKEEAELDTSKYTANNWYMAYNPKLKLLHFMVRITPKENISGQINPLFKIPVKTVGNDLVMSETGRNCLIYGDGLLIQGSNTWSSGDAKRFSVMARIR